MSDPLDTLVGDPDLITQVRGGDRQAFGELYRRHVAAATNLARQFAHSAATVDDLVAESFAKVLQGLLSGSGPDTAFRAYLFTTVRHTAYDRTRKDAKLSFTDDDTEFDRPMLDPDPVLLNAENQLVGRAYHALPERWQAVLWYLTVEGHTPVETGRLLGIAPNAVSSLAFRAREGLREAYLQAHLAETDAARCRAIINRLGAWTRDGLSARERAVVDSHLATCDDCRALAAELTEVNSSLRALLAPLLLGSAAVGYLSLLGPAAALTKIGVLAAGGAAAGGAAAGGAAGSGAAGGAIGGAAAAANSGAAVGGILGVLRRVPRTWALAAGGAAAAAVVAVAVLILTFTSGPSNPAAKVDPSVAATLFGAASHADGADGTAGTEGTHGAAGTTGPDGTVSASGIGPSRASGSDGVGPGSDGVGPGSGGPPSSGTAPGGGSPLSAVQPANTQSSASRRLVPTSATGGLGPTFTSDAEGATGGITSTGTVSRSSGTAPPNTTSRTLSTSISTTAPPTNPSATTTTPTSAAASSRTTSATRPAPISTRASSTTAGPPTSTTRSTTRVSSSTTATTAPPAPTTGAQPASPPPPPPPPPPVPPSPPPVLPGPGLPTVTGLNLVNLTLTIRVPLRNPGAAATSASTLSVDAAGLLVTTSLTVSDAGSALRGRGAFLTGSATAIGCSAAGCPLPPIAAHSAIVATITLKLTSPDLTKISGLTIEIAVDGRQLVSLKLPALLPVFSASTTPLVAGETGDFDVTARFTDLTAPIDPGDLTIKRDNGQVILAGGTSCTTTVTEVRCPAQPAGPHAFAYHFRATTLPAAVDQPQQFPVALNGTPGTVSVPGVTVRSPGGAIDMTGPFQGAIVGEATTRCEVKSGRCRYESGVQDAGLRTFTVAGRTVLWAELTWLAPAGLRADDPLGSTTRDLVLVSPTQPQDRQLLPVTGRAAPSANGFVAISADVTDEINAALTVRATSAVSMPVNDSAAPANRLTSEMPTGWTLSVIWATVAGPPHQIQTFGPSVNPGLVAEKKAQFHILVAPAGAPVEQAGALLLWTTAHHSIRDRTMSQGEFCILGRCLPRGWSDLTTLIDGAHGQSVIFRLAAAQGDHRRVIVVGPSLVQRSVHEGALDVPIPPPAS